MNEYILLMHQDAPDTEAADDSKCWAQYIAKLRSTGQFDGGSSIGRGERLRKIIRVNRPTMIWAASSECVQPASKAPKSF